MLVLAKLENVEISRFQMIISARKIKIKRNPARKFSQIIHHPYTPDCSFIAFIQQNISLLTCVDLQRHTHTCTDVPLWPSLVYLALDIVEAEHPGAQAPPDVPQWNVVWQMFSWHAVIHALCTNLALNHIQRTALNFKYNTCYNTTYLAKLERL